MLSVWLWGTGSNRFLVQVLPKRQTAILRGKRIFVCKKSYVPQGSLLGPPLFLIYINDLPNCLDHSIGRSFADDTNLTFSAVDLSILQTEMSNDLNRIFNWISSNKLTLNILKTDFMVIGSRQRIVTLAGSISLSVNGLTLQQVESTKCLGLTIDQFLTWRNHLQSVRQKVGCGIRILKTIRPFVGLEHLINVYRFISWALFYL